MGEIPPSQTKKKNEERKGEENVLFVSAVVFVFLNVGEGIGRTKEKKGERGETGAS